MGTFRESGLTVHSVLERVKARCFRCTLDTWLTAEKRLDRKSMLF